MKPEAQRIAIAEACGIVSKDQWGPLYRTQHGIVRDCPDYLNDLNAMHEAERTLTTDQLVQQAEWIGACSNEMHMKAWVILLKATAAQRAEAFLRTLGKWEEGA